MGNVITNVVFVEVMGEGDARNLNSGYIISLATASHKA